MKQSDDEIRLAEFRALREESWRLVRADLAAFQHDLGERGIGERIRDRIGEEANEAWAYTRDLAAEHRAILAATIAAVAAWLLRRPIGDAIGALGNRKPEPPGRQNVEAVEGDRT